MAFALKEWKDLPDQSTPINRTSLRDLEKRVTDYSDLLVASIPAGAQGPAGPGTYQKLRDLFPPAVSPEAVTDWGSKINAAWAAGTKALYVEHKVGTTTPTEYPVTTQIDATAQSGLSLIGEAGWGGHAGGTTGGDKMVRLVWKGGVGTGPMLKHAQTDAFTATSIAFVYDHTTTFADTLVKIQSNPSPSGVNSGDGLFHCCFFGSDDNASTAANILLDMECAVGYKIEYCQFGGAKYAIHGHRTNATTNCDDNNILYCLFGNMRANVGIAICNPGTAMRIIGNVFGMGGFGGAKWPTVIGSDHTTPITSRFTFNHNRIWDPVDTSHIYFNQTANNPWVATFDDNWFQQMDGLHWNLQGTGSITITNNDIGRLFNGANTATPIIDAGSSTTAFKERLIVKYNRWGVIDGTKWNFITNYAGHGQVDISHNGTSSVQAAVEISTVGRQALSYNPGMGLTVTNKHANIVGVGVRANMGNDYAGFIELDTINTDVPAGSKIADFTFKIPGVGFNNISGSGPTQRMPIVRIGVSAELGRHDNAAVGIAFASQFYALVTANDQTFFSLINQAIVSSAGNKRLLLTYQIIFV